MPNLSASGLLFSTVKAFVLQPELTKRRVKRDDLDTLTEVYTGPAGGEDTFIPPIGTPHAQYSLMTLIDASSKQLPGLVVEVTLDYHGKFNNAGASGYTSVPTVNKSWMEGEVTYQVNSSAGYSTPIVAGSGPTIAYTAFTYTMHGIASYSRRYTGKCVQLAYITNRVPTGQPSGIGLSKGFLGFENVWDTMTGFSAGVQLTGGGAPIIQMACTDVRVEDRADGWWRVTETYQSKMFPGPTGYQVSAPSLGGGAPGNIASDTKNPTTDPNSPWTVNSQTTTNQSQVASNTPSSIAISGGYDVTGSDQGSSLYVDSTTGATTESQTGMDPNLSGYPPISNDPVAVDQGTEPFSSSSSAASAPQPDQAVPVLVWGT